MTPSNVSAQNQGFLISPTRIILNNQTKSSVIHFVNNFNHPLAYRLVLETLRMDSNGQVTVVGNPSELEKKAKELIQYSPRQILIPPKSNQICRIMAKNIPDLPDGEYLTYLHFSPLPDNNDPSAPNMDSKSSFSLNVKVGASIPIFFRNNTKPPVLQITNYQEVGKEAVITIQKQGNTSCYGKIIISSDKIMKSILSEVSGISLHATTEKRILKIPCDSSPSHKSSKVFVTYISMEDNTRDQILASAEF